MFSIRSITILVFSLVLALSSTAQDIHYTQFNLAPLTVNPSLTGKYEGTFRVGGLYRDQWRSAIPNQFVTPSVYLDAPVLPVKIGKKEAWFGVGAVVLNDKAGEVAFNNTSILGSLAFHLPVGANGNTVISIGGQGGMIQRRLDKSAARFQDEIGSGGTGIGTSQDLNNITDDNVSFGDYNAGVTVHSRLNKNMDFNVGFALHHLSSPEYSLYTAAAASTQSDELRSLPMRMAGHGQFNVGLSDKWTLSPTFMYQSIASAADEMWIQVMAGHHFNEAKDITLNFGTGYRLGDAIPAIIGFDYKGFKLGMAYDITSSDFTTANAGKGGFELAASYIAKIRKTPVVKPVIFCPRF